MFVTPIEAARALRAFALACGLASAIGPAQLRAQTITSAAAPAADSASSLAPPPPPTPTTTTTTSPTSPAVLAQGASSLAPPPTTTKPSSPAVPTQGASSPGSGRMPSGVVNINTAGAAELERLPGIGPARAKAILELRARIAHFSRLEDLLRVKGIGRATFRKLRPYLALEGETTLRD